MAGDLYVLLLLEIPVLESSFQDAFRILTCSFLCGGDDSVCRSVV
ncbi:MAG: hypothetical protein K0S79_1827 [Nitrospira sp.]|nr:hypothetical protein [Nitrospira sp.]